MFSFLKSFFPSDSQHNSEQEMLIALRKSMEKEATNEIEELYVKTFDDLHNVEDFCQLFRKTEFYILGEIVGAEQVNKEEGSCILGKNNQLKLPVFKIKNEPMNIFFTSREKFEKAVKDKEYNKYILCRFSDVINEPDYPFVMNPGYSISRVFEPSLMKSILNGENVNFSLPSLSALPDDEKIYIGIPPKKPEKLISVLLDYVNQHKVFESIVIAQLKDKKNGTRICVGLEFINNTECKPLFYGEMNNLVSKILNDGEYIDFIEKGNGLGDLVFKHGVKIY